MQEEDRLNGKKVLIVDDEPDVLETLRLSLETCEVETAATYEEGKKMLETQDFDIVILDIMGVNGFGLLEVANKRNVISVMLTAHALRIENIVSSYKKGAASFLPKEKMPEIRTFLNDILEAKEKGKDPWWRWMGRLASFWKYEFGHNWQELGEKEFWDKLKKL